MAFHVVRARRFTLPEPLSENQISITKSGDAMLLVGALAVQNIGDTATVVADTELLRVGLRKPHPDELEFAYRVRAERTKGGRDRGRRKVNLGPAIRGLGLEPSDVVGRYELSTVEDLLFVTLTDASSRDRVLAAKRNEYRAKHKHPAEAESARQVSKGNEGGKG